MVAVLLWHNTLLQPTVVCSWEPEGCLRGSQGSRKPQSPISACIPQRLVPRSPCPPHPLPPRNPPQAQVLQASFRGSRLWPAPPSPLPAAACPAGQVFVNCSDLHADPELSRERTCEQQLLNLSVPARGPCLSGCACPQGYVSVLPWVSIPERLAEPGTTGWSEGQRKPHTVLQGGASPGLPRYSVITSEESEKEQESGKPSLSGVYLPLLFTNVWP